jgi:hypothetical protein
MGWIEMSHPVSSCGISEHRDENFASSVTPIVLIKGSSSGLACGEPVEPCVNHGGMTTSERKLCGELPDIETAEINTDRQTSALEKEGY